MKIINSIVILFLLICGLYSQLLGQSTAERVYTITQAKCVGCHNPTDMAGGLDLQGSGTSLPAQMADVRAHLYDINSANAVSGAKGHRIVYPGDPYRSTLFRKINNGLAADDVLEAGEESEGSPHNQTATLLSDLEKETIRQWIIYGAASTDAVPHELLEQFYAGGGYWGVAPENIPAKPGPEQGFQIHFGPLFLAPDPGSTDANVEFFSRYITPLLENRDVVRLESFIGSSHHLILYKYQDGQGTEVPPGLRTNGMQGSTKMVVGWQSPGYNDLELPAGTAFRWEAGGCIDIDAHIINFSNTSILANDMYVNVYTAPAGTAAQEMHSDLLIYPLLYIPNDGQPHSFEFNYPYFGAQDQTIYVWALSSHTHQLATDYDVWLNRPDGTLGEHIFDGSCEGGLPTNNEIGYDYQHPPTRVWEPFLTLDLNYGLHSKATYLNNGPIPLVTWGETNNDEMMITGVLYVTDTTGINFNTPTAIDESLNRVENYYLFPNPAQDRLYLQMPYSSSTRHIAICDLSGKIILDRITPPGEGICLLDTSDLPRGMYIYTIDNNEKQMAKGKLLIK